MKFSFLDRSTYLKGLLILSRKDNNLAPQEKEVIREIGKRLNFESRFIEGAISELMENEYLIDEPVIFSGRDIALQFLKDGIRLAVSDKILHRKEISYLRSVARVNSISDDEFKELLCDYGKIEAPIEYVKNLELININDAQSDYLPA